MIDMKKALCLACGGEFDVDETVYACPSCGDEGIPADPSVRPEFKITWHELRCLVMWAEFWATSQDDDAHKTMRKVVYGIADRLHIQHMDGPPLTFSQEIADLRTMPGIANIEITKSDGSPSPFDK